MRYLVLLFALLAIGCSSEPAEKASTTETTPTATAPETPKDTPPPTATAPGQNVKATLNEKQLDTFFTRFGTKIAHGLKPEDRKGLITQIKSVPVGQEKTGTIHLDHNGQHINVNMTIKHEAADQYTLGFDPQDASLAKEIEGHLKASGGK